MVLVLSRQELNQLTPLFDRKTVLYSQIQNEIRHYMGADYTHVFARPVYSQNIVRWDTEGQESLSWKALNEVQQQKLLVATRSILSDIQKVTQSHPQSILARLFSQCSQFPSLDCLYAVDGCPVITAWGYAGQNGTVSLLENNDIQSKSVSLGYWRKFPWVTALSAMVAGLLVSIFWGNHDMDGKRCQAVYPSYDQTKQAVDAQNENKRLVLERNYLLDQWNTLEKQCQIPSVKPLVPITPPEFTPLQESTVPPEVPPVQNSPNLLDTHNMPSIKTPQKKEIPGPSPLPPPPDKKADLPQDSWNKKDTSMLNGCWHLTTHLELYTHGLFFTSHQPVTKWSLCFSPNAAGEQVLTRTDGGTCKGPLQAGFQGSQLVLNQPEDCEGDFHLISGKNVCTRLNDHEARCVYIDENGHQSTGIFKR